LNVNVPTRSPSGAKGSSSIGGRRRVLGGAYGFGMLPVTDAAPGSSGVRLVRERLAGAGGVGCAEGPAGVSDSGCASAPVRLLAAGVVLPVLIVTALLPPAVGLAFVDPFALRLRELVESKPVVPAPKPGGLP
jgi:hypothetical protein